MDERPEPTFDVVWPKAPLATRSRAAAPRLASLRGARIAFAWDHMFRGDELFPVLADELRRRFDVEVVSYEAFGNLHGPRERELVAALPAALAMHRIDGVVSGNGC